MQRWPVIFYFLAVFFSFTSCDYRIVGGADVTEGSYPDITWQVGLIISGTRLCGGTIISNRYILTAAHCVKDIYTDYIATPAAIDVRTGISITTPENLYGIAIWVHPTYKNANIANNAILVDLAVIELNRPIVFTSMVSAIALPRHVDVTPHVSDYIVSGYGTTLSSHGGSSGAVTRLLYVHVPYVDYNICNAAAPFTVPLVSVCAGGVAGKDSCQGDSGGPLVANIGTTHNPNFVLAGIVSSGTRINDPLCAVTSEYGIYVDIKKALSFIDEIVREGPSLPPIILPSNANCASVIGTLLIVVFLTIFI